MLKNIIPLLSFSFCAIAVNSEELVLEQVSESTAPSLFSEPADAASCPVQEPLSSVSESCSLPERSSCELPEPAPKTCAKPAPKPCAKPCPPKSCTPPKPCCWNFNPCNPKIGTDMKGGGLYLTGDFLYWRSENHGFSYAYQLKSISDNVGKVVRLDPQWEPAFRAGLGWNTSYDFWDVLLNYTWFRNSIRDTHTSSIGFIRLIPLSNSSTGQFSAVTAHSRLIMNMGDLEVGRMVYLTKSVAIRPFWGGKGGTLHQKFTSDFSGILSGTDDEFKFSGKQNYWGAGPRAGMNGEWHLSHGFSLLGKAAGALLYGKMKVQSFSEHLATDAAAFTLDRQCADNFYQLVPTLQLALGFQWESWFWCEQMLYRMSASWESNYWWDQFNLPVGVSGFTAPLPTVGNQALTLEGLTVNVEFDF